MYAASLLFVLAPSVPDLTHAGLHELVGLLPRYGEQEWSSPEKPDDALSVRALRELRSRLEKGAVLDLTDWKTILLQKDYLHWRARWPASEPFAVRLHLPMLYQGLVLELRPRLPGWHMARAAHWEMMCGLGEQIRYDEERYQELGLLPRDLREVVFDLTVRTPLWGRGNASGGTVQRTDRPGSIAIEVEAVPSQSELLPRLADAALAEQTGKQLAAGMYLQTASDSSGSTYVLLGGVLEPVPVGTAVCVEGVLCQEGRALERLSFELRRDRTRFYCRCRRLPLQAATNESTARGWSLKLHGIAAGALHDWDATQYWAGEIEVPLVDLIRH